MMGCLVHQSIMMLRKKQGERQFFLTKPRVYVRLHLYPVYNSFLLRSVCLVPCKRAGLTCHDASFSTGCLHQLARLADVT